ncbi:MAG: flippase [Thermodesulfobacteriota bacterium]
MAFERRSSPAKAELLETAARGSALTFCGTVAEKILFLAVRVAVVRLFGARYFGLLILGTMVTEVSRIFASIGLPRGGMRFLSLSIGAGKLEKLPGVFGTALLIPLAGSILFASILTGTSSFIAQHIFKNADLAPVLTLLALSVPFITVVRVCSELSKGFRTTRYAVLTENLFIPSVTAAIFLLLYLAGLGFNSIIYALIISNASGVCVILFLLMRQFRGVSKRPWSVAGFLKESLRMKGGAEFVTYSIPLFLNGFTAVVMKFTDVTMLGIFLDETQVGVYAAASMFAVFLSSSVNMSINSIIAPMVATEHGRKNTENIKHIFISTTRWMLYVSLPVAVFVIVARDNVMLLFGERFLTDGPMVLFILTIGHMVNCITGGTGNVLSMTGHQHKELGSNIAAMALNVALNLLLIPAYGVIGAAIATSSTLVVANALRVIWVYRIFNVHPFASGPLKLLAVGAFFLLVSFVDRLYLPNWYNTVLAFISVLTIFPLIYLISFEKEDHDLLNHIKNTLLTRRPGTGKAR